jgi:hypothetical protein
VDNGLLLDESQPFDLLGEQSRWAEEQTNAARRPNNRETR